MSVIIPRKEKGMYEQTPKKPLFLSMQSGIVSKTYGRFYGIIPENNLEIEFQASMRGRLRLQKRRASPQEQRQRHILTIGDRVLFSCIDDKVAPPTARIETIQKRENSLERSHSHEIHCLGANLSHAVIVLSLTLPVPHFGLLDRFLCAAYHGKVEPWIVFTKKDLFQKQGGKIKDFFPIQLYKSLGYPVFCINTLEKNEVYVLKKKLNFGCLLFVGQSGVGKSTLINQILDQDYQKTREISEATGHGKHTTTNGCLFILPKTKAMLIDTPGLREWGLFHISKRDILSSFPEIHPRTLQCHFSDCTHDVNSVDCAVQELLTKNKYHLDQKDYGHLIEQKECLHPSRLHSIETILQRAYR